jgi:hypothetical protein
MQRCGSVSLSQPLAGTVASLSHHDISRGSTMCFFPALRYPFCGYA